METFEGLQEPHEGSTWAQRRLRMRSKGARVLLALTISREGNREDEARSASAFAFDAHKAIVRFDDSPSNEQAESCPVARRGTRRVVAIEEPIHVLGLDARPIIGNRKYGRTPVTPEPDRHDAGFGRELDGISQKVREDL